MASQFAYIHASRFHDGQRFVLDMQREERRFMACVPRIAPFAREERWIVCARDQQEAVKTVGYHFGHSALSYTLTAASPLSETPADGL